ncbi:MAG: hypothetical protein ACT4P5_11160, partial [Armatimonadota bacterium]
SYGTPSESVPARGTVPTKYFIKTRTAIVATFTKTAAEGELVVSVLVEGHQVQRRTTSAPVGTIVVNQRFSP